MKIVVLVGFVIAMLTRSVAADAVPLSGSFIPEVDKTIQWMVEAKRPALSGDEAPERYKEIAYSGAPLIHHWNDGKLTVELTKKWTEPIKLKWEKISDSTFKSVAPWDDNNTELIRVIEIGDKNNYYIEITVNGRVTREYFTRTEPTENRGEPADTDNPFTPPENPKKQLAD